MNCLRQQEIVNKFKNLKAGALFMEMGTGKTKTILDIYKAKNLHCKIVYICPASLMKSTKKEVSKWGDFDIEFFTCESIGSSDNLYMGIIQFLREFECFLVVDESIKFKNLSSKRTQRLLKVCELAKYRFILNGTPITRSILDLLAQMNILSPKILNMSEAQFANTFLEYRLDTGEKAPWRSWSKPHNEEALLKMISPYVAEASLDLDIQTHIKKEYVRLSQSETEDYSDFKREVLQGFCLEQRRFLEIAQAFQHHYTFCSEKIDLLLKEVQDNTLIFVKFKKWFEVLKNYFDFGIFNSDIKDDLELHNIGVLSYGCGAFGLNLQKFNRVIFLDQTFDYGQKIQALSRVRRIGQTKNIEVVDIFVETGLENIIERSLSKKTGTTENVLSILKSMDKKELVKL